MLKKMDSVHFQEMARQDRNKLRASLIALAVLGMVILFAGINAGINTQNIVLAMGISAIALLTAVAGIGAFALRLTSKMEKDSFHEGMYLIMEGVPMNCTIIDEKGVAMHCNDYALKLFDATSKEEYCAKLFTDFLPEIQPDGTPSLEVAGRHMKTAFENGIGSFQWWHQKGKGGELILCEITLVAASVYGSNRILVFLKDLSIEKIRKQEAALKERMQAIMDSSPMLCIVADENARLLDVNKEAENLFDIPDRQMLLDDFANFVPPLQPDGSNSLQKTAALAREAVRMGHSRSEIVYRKKDGTLIPTEAVVNRITVDGKNLVIVYSRDLRAEYASKEKGTLVQQNIKTMMEQLNGSVSEQASAVTQSAAAVEQMVTNIQYVTTALTKNAEQVKELRSASEVGHVSINEVVSDIRGIAAESESLMAINSVMQNIASQTNLLSMNAAIEAAHAGESGRGFAVVADEIRKLAESSSKQSKTINTVLKTIKTSIDKITKSAENVLVRFDTIDGGIKTVVEQERGVLNAMEEQKQGSQQVLQAIGQVSDITQRVKNDAQQMVQRQQAALTISAGN